MIEQSIISWKKWKIDKLISQKKRQISYLNFKNNN